MMPHQVRADLLALLRTPGDIPVFPIWITAVKTTVGLFLAQAHAVFDGINMKNQGSLWRFFFVPHRMNIQGSTILDFQI